MATLMFVQEEIDFESAPRKNTGDLYYEAEEIEEEDHDGKMFRVKWKGYKETSWIPKQDKCASSLAGMETVKVVLSVSLTESHISMRVKM